MNKIFSFIIIGLFSTMIIGGSGWTLKSVLEKESNWVFLNRIYGFRSVVATTPDTKTVVSEINNCEIILDQNDKGGVSIVNYLKNRGQESSFKERAKLAKNFNIENYSGSSAQNLLLLKNLKLKENNCE